MSLCIYFRELCMYFVIYVFSDFVLYLVMPFRPFVSSSVRSFFMYFVVCSLVRSFFL